MKNNSISQKEFLSVRFKNNNKLAFTYLNEFFLDPETTDEERATVLSEVVEALGYTPEFDTTALQSNTVQSTSVFMSAFKKLLLACHDAGFQVTFTPYEKQRSQKVLY